MITQKGFVMCTLSLLLCISLVSLLEVDSPEQTSTTPEEITAEVAETEQSEEVIEDTQSQDKTTPIIITNAIATPMLAYKHWTGTYSPDVFVVYLNGTSVAMGETYTLDSVDTPLVVQFDYSFMNGMRKGSKKIVYQLNKECTHTQLTFSWLDTYKINIDNATVIREDVV